ncbi:MAG: zinc-binding dehydrogenase, partial [Candidatus Omnitrophota bacterium]
MKQVIARRGNVVVDEVPAPIVSANTVLVRVAYSCISAGTEMSTVASSGKSRSKKAMQYPRQIKKAFRSIKISGLHTTIEKAQGRFTEGSQLGYSAAGTVMEVGENIDDIKLGDRVACAGAGIANHAEYINIPRNLLVKIPEGVEFDVASTVTLGAIAMQGARRADVRLGEYVVVIGLGILGQLIVQILKVSGIRTIGIDIDERRVKAALDLGLDFGFVAGEEDIVTKVIAVTNGYGADAVIVATATKSK